jgi:hypothetical protein
LETIAARYRVVGEDVLHIIGDGNFGAVRRGHAPSGDRKVIAFLKKRNGQTYRSSEFRSSITHAGCLGSGTLKDAPYIDTRSLDEKGNPRLYSIDWLEKQLNEMGMSTRMLDEDFEECIVDMQDDEEGEDEEEDEDDAEEEEVVPRPIVRQLPDPDPDPVVEPESFVYWWQMEPMGFVYHQGHKQDEQVDVDVDKMVKEIRKTGMEKFWRLTWKPSLSIEDKGKSMNE